MNQSLITKELKKLNFDIKILKFEKKIKYVVLENQPENLHLIKENEKEK